MSAELLNYVIVGGVGAIGYIATTAILKRFF